jgi:hypothetical protein
MNMIRLPDLLTSAMVVCKGLKIRFDERACQHLFIKINVLMRRDRVAEGSGALGHDPFDLGLFYF